LPAQPKTGGVIVNSSDSYPLHYVDNSKGSNPAHNVQGYDNFWLKDNRYSLYDMLGAEKMGIKSLVDSHFVGGTVYQAFLDPWCYHRWYFRKVIQTWRNLLSLQSKSLTWQY